MSVNKKEQVATEVGSRAVRSVVWGGRKRVNMTYNQIRIKKTPKPIHHIHTPIDNVEADGHNIDEDAGDGAIYERGEGVPGGTNRIVENLRGILLMQRSPGHRVYASEQEYESYGAVR